jgi:hypothetical protein
LLFDGGDHGFWFDIDTWQGDLGGLNLGGGLIFGAEPADMSVTFFGGAFGVEGDEALMSGTFQSNKESLRIMRFSFLDPYRDLLVK